jgi:ribosomal protein S6--L-glutamate ligase
LPSDKRTSRQIISNNNTLRAKYNLLGPGDIFIGRLRLKPSEEPILLDLVSRGVQLFPSAVSQLASRSKIFQAILFAQHMVPHTLAIHAQHDLLGAINKYGEHGVAKVVSKHDRHNAGMGIHLWNSIEDLYTQASFGGQLYPFVIQPFYENCRDIRVVVLGDYIEAYWRHNPNNFRNNLHCGGESSSCELTTGQWELCRKVMERGDFPYAHIDLMVTESSETYLGEINLRGGIRGAKINSDDYIARLKAIHQKQQDVLEKQKQ